MVKLKRIIASTLIEVIVAMIIISLIAGMTSSFILQNFKSTNISNKAKALLILDNEVELSEREKDYTDFVKEIDDYKIERTTTNNKLDEKLKTITFTVKDKKDNVICSRSKVLQLKSGKN